jgi:hypothetical protein
VKLELKRDGRPVLVDLRLEEQPSLALEALQDPPPGQPAKKRGNSADPPQR